MLHAFEVLHAFVVLRTTLGSYAIRGFFLQVGGMAGYRIVG
ncbi:MAG TPA: hypothetical protein VKR60_07665 [Candidatus Sulfotelmatobacter sp.]|nr:hypothetical protein [Candidatus Sulfotelmatobacter sp.]